MSSGNILHADGGEPWKDKERMIELHEEQDYNYTEMADIFGCSPATVSTWMKKHKAEEMRKDLDVEIPDENPHRDEDLMRTLYVDEEMSQSDISAVIGKSTGCVGDWLKRHGIETRSISEGMSIARGGSKDWYFITNPKYGHEVIRPNRQTMVFVHRLTAVAEFGFDAVKDKDVHHVNGIPWDNRPDNLQLVDNSEHMRIHGGGHNWLDHLRATEMYREGASSYKIAPRFDVSPGTIINWVREVDPETVRGVGGEGS